MKTDKIRAALKWILIPGTLVVFGHALLMPSICRVPLDRLKEANAKFSMRSLAAALEAYHSERGAYPASIAAFPPEVTKDPFDEKSRFAYRVDSSGWVLVSKGLNRVWDVSPMILQVQLSTQSALFFERILPVSYDPTNGTFSHGDVWRVHQ